MNTVLRVLVVVILVLSGLALALAVGLFGRRELLIGRTHVLETQLIKIAKTIEQADPADPVRPSLTPRDIAKIESKELDNPERSAFWDGYQYKLETPNLPVIDLDNEAKKLQLRQYYRIGADGKKVIDPLSNKPATSGPGTMQELLDTVLTRATAQNATLNKTRVELAKVRTELDDTIKDLNEVKRNARTDKKTIEDKQKEIDSLKDEKANLERKIKGLEEEKISLNAEIAEGKNEITKQKEEIADLGKKLKDMDKELQKRIGQSGPIRDGGPLVSAKSFEGKVSPGDKGKIVAADDKFKFVVAELSDAFITEILGPNRDGALPQLELMVRRPGLKSASGEFVTRIKLRQILRQQNLVVADVLSDWQQVPAAKDDVVFF